MRIKHMSNVIFRVALILLCLVLFSAHLSSGMLAKYTSAGVGDDVSRVAHPEYTVTSTQTGPTITSAGLGTYDFTVTNTGEITADLSLYIYLMSDTLNSAQLTKAFSNVTVNGTDCQFDADEKAYICPLDVFTPADSVDYTLSFRARDLAATSTAASPTAKYENIKVNIAVKSVQID